MEEIKFSMKQFGEVLYELRRRYDLVQDDIALDIGITKAAYSAIENGRYGASDSVKLKIFDFFKRKGEKNLSMDHFFGLVPLGKRLYNGEETDTERLRQDLQEAISDRDRYKNIVDALLNKEGK